MGFYRPLIRHHNGYSRFNHRDLDFRIGFGFSLVKREGPAVEVCSLAHNPSPC